MKKLATLAVLATTSMFADPGIMIDIDIFIEKPSGTGQVEIACK